MSFPTIVFDDGQGLLSPLTDLRPAFDVRTGMSTTLERLRNWLPVVALFVPKALADLTIERHAAADPKLIINDPALPGLAGPVLLINGRAPLAASLALDLKPGQGLFDPDSGNLIAAVCAASEAPAILAGDCTALAPVANEHLRAGPPTLLSRPWHLRSLRDACIKADFDWHIPRRMKDIGWPQLPAGTLCMGTNPLAISPESDIGPGVIFDSTGGPILIDDDVTIRPGAIICGPAAILAHSHVLDRCLIKPNTVIGPSCKVAGEIGGTIFQGFANKAHDGHLGDAYIGEWANLGAGTTNSNLLNTYGEVIARPLDSSGRAAANERTGEQFLGCIVGDHVKFAICTRIMTGAIIGTGTMWAASAPVTGTISPMSWVTDAGAKPFAAAKFIEIARTVMARRRLPLSAAYQQRLQALAARPAST